MYFANTKSKEITTDNGYVVTDYAGNNSISFFADIPKNAVVDTIKVDGAFINDIGREKIIEYPRERTDGELREICTVYFKGDVPQKLIDDINFYRIKAFEVYCHEEVVIKE